MSIRNLMQLSVFILSLALTITFAIKVFITKDKDKLVAASILTVLFFAAAVALLVIVK